MTAVLNRGGVTERVRAPPRPLNSTRKACTNVRGFAPKDLSTPGRAHAETPPSGPPRGPLGFMTRTSSSPMVAATSGAEKGYEKNGWYFLLALGAFGIVFSITAFVGGTSFGPSIAKLEIAQLTAGVLFLGFSILSVAISLNSYRRGERWAWYASWYWVVIPLFFVSQGGPWAVNGVLVAVALLGLFLPIRKFFPKPPPT